MTNVEKIIIVANQLANQGKKPSIALIKSKLASPVPLPQIISTLRSWSHDPENCVLKEESTENNKTDQINDIKELDNVALNDLNNALAPIHKELAEIKEILKKLTAQ